MRKIHLSNAAQGVLAVLVIIAAIIGAYLQQRYGRAPVDSAPAVIITEIGTARLVEESTYYDVIAYEWHDIERKDSSTVTGLLWFVNIDTEVPEDDAVFDADWSYATMLLLNYGFAEGAEAVLIVYVTSLLDPGQPLIVAAIGVNRSDWAAWRVAYPEPTAMEILEFERPQFINYDVPYLYKCSPDNGCVALD